MLSFVFFMACNKVQLTEEEQLQRDCSADTPDAVACYQIGVDLLEAGQHEQATGQFEKACAI